MSRCFPFPPPGYEREHRLEDPVLLKEAKHKEHKDKKEKKEKKEKKDKDRKKDKEKKEKDGSEKKRDKKDRKHKDKKEKHKDKKKEKDDRVKDKDKSSLSEESTIATKLEERSGEKVHPEGHNKDRSFEGEGNCFTQFQSQNGKNPLFGTVHWDPSQVPGEAKHNDVDKSFHVKKLDLQCNGEFTEKAAVQNLTRVSNSGNEGIPRLLKEQNVSRLEDKEKHKEMRGSKQGEKEKDRDRKSHGKDKHKKKEKKEEKKKEEKAYPKTEYEKSESKIVGRNDFGGTTFHGSVNLPKDVVGTAVVEGSIKKRKDLDTNTNGFLHESEFRPNKAQKLALHPSTQNGRKLEASSKYSSAVPNNIRPDLNNGTKDDNKPSPSKPNRTFGIEKCTDQIIIPPKTPHHDLSNINVASKGPKVKDHASEASRRPPHPDLKYLNQILTVPVVGDWSGNDDQEWLFSKKGPLKKPETESVRHDEELQVWSEAVHIESADVCALPYVIPY